MKTTSVHGVPRYYVTWDTEMMDASSSSSANNSINDTWMRLRVRCQYKDKTFNTWKGTTIASYRFRDN